ncbi:ABC transporter ATP-binding protein [Faunimonas sp. B44]|uniref:ABC transporter ATP-binding protein n=1 Tax=Faunimonas sp. B44 TaxID=3461493 RepID=UPI0040446FFA
MPHASEIAFEIRGLAVSVGGRQLVGTVDLDVRHGEVTALIGRNGSGKSTLLKVLARQVPASSGTVAFEGRPLQSWERRAFARAVAYLPQEPPAAAGLTVRELVGYGRYPWHGALGRFGAADEAGVARAMALTGVERFAGRMIETLSGGERQRAWIAMLIAQESRCLLLDEPTSALDVQHQMEILTLVRDLSRETDASVLLVLHDVNMAARFADRICALRDGGLVAEGPPGDLMAPDMLDTVYGLPMAVIPHPAGAGPVALPL